MDSKNIYISSQTYLRKVVWLSNDLNSEWTYIGNNILQLKLLVENLFDVEQTLYLVTNRHNSKQADKLKILENAKEFIEKEGFLIWNLSFKKVIQVNKIGVYKIGEYTI